MNLYLLLRKENVCVIKKMFVLLNYMQCATGNLVPVDPVDYFRSGTGPVPAKYRPD